MYLDMDGVLVNFFKGVCLKFKKDYDYHSLTEYDFWNPWGVTREQVNIICNSDFWANLEWMHDGHFILNSVVEKFGFDNIYLLTAPMPNPGSWTGKFLWVRRNLPCFENRIIITQAPKSLFAGPDTLLIDDKDENIEGFRAAGGQAFLINRPWNKGRSDKTVEDLKRFLEER